MRSWRRRSSGSSIRSRTSCRCEGDAAMLPSSKASKKCAAIAVDHEDECSPRDNETFNRFFSRHGSRSLEKLAAKYEIWQAAQRQTRQTKRGRRRATKKKQALVAALHFLRGRRPSDMSAAKDIFEVVDITWRHSEQGDLKGYGSWKGLYRDLQEGLDLNDEMQIAMELIGLLYWRKHWA